MLVDKKSDIQKTRFYLLQYITNIIKAVSITNVVEKESSSVKAILEKFKHVDDLISPIRIVSKEFYPMSDKQTIFNGCDMILSKVEQDRFEYERFLGTCVGTNPYYIWIKKYSEVGAHMSYFEPIYEQEYKKEYKEEEKLI